MSREKYVTDEYLEVWFIALKEIESKTVFGTALVQAKKSNC